MRLYDNPYVVCSESAGTLCVQNSDPSVQLTDAWWLIEDYQLRLFATYGDLNSQVSFIISFDEVNAKKGYPWLVSGGSSSKFPLDGVSEGYYYVYLGADSIDPASISVAGKISPGKAVTISVGPGTSKTYGGTVSYEYQYSLNGGVWTKIDTTANTSIFFTIPSGTQNIQFRVRAVDDLGFSSDTYVESAAFYVDRYTVSVEIVPANGGTISGAGSFYEGTSVTVHAAPADGYEFIGWEDGGSVISTAASYKFTVSKDRSLTAVFKQKLTAWVGVDSKARKGVELWVGVNGKARKAVKAWVGVEGKARRWL